MGMDFLKNLKEKAILGTAGQLLKGVKNGAKILEELKNITNTLTENYKLIEEKYGSNFLKNLAPEQKEEAIKDIRNYIHLALSEIDKMTTITPEQKKVAKKQAKKHIIKLIKNSNPDFKKMKTKQIERLLGL